MGGGGVGMWKRDEECVAVDNTVLIGQVIHSVAACWCHERLMLSESFYRNCLSPETDSTTICSSS